MTDEIKNWRKAHHEIDVNDNALATMAPFPSLAVNDYAAYLASRGSEAEGYVRALGRETVWAYGNWRKAQRDANPAKLLLDMLNNTSAHCAPHDDYVRKFIVAYAAANNIQLSPSVPEAGWQAQMATVQPMAPQP